MGNSCITGASKDPTPALLGKVHDPAFKWKFYGFSALLDREAVPANSAIFRYCGYGWFLKVSPMHKKTADEIPHIALSLSVSKNSLKEGDILSAVVELSMYNHSKGTYHGRRASYHFNINKKQSKKQCLIPLEELLKSSDFLVDDSCVFGVRILKADVSSQNKSIVIPKKPITVQNIFLQKKGFIKGTYTWTMNNFLDMKVQVRSPAFEVGGHKWYINMYPLGDQYSTNSLSLYLHLHDLNKNPLETGMVIELTLFILDQKHEKHHMVTGRFMFAVATKNGWGWSNFIPLKTLMDPSRCYIVGYCGIRLYAEGRCHHSLGHLMMVRHG